MRRSNDVKGVGGGGGGIRRRRGFPLARHVSESAVGCDGWTGSIVGGMAGRSAGIGRWWRLRCRPLFSGRRIVVGLRQPFVVVALVVVVRLFFATPQDFIHLLHLWVSHWVRMARMASPSMLLCRLLPGRTLSVDSFGKRWIEFWILKNKNINRCDLCASHQHHNKDIHLFDN